MPGNMDEALAEFRQVLEDAAKTAGVEVMIPYLTIVGIMTRAVGRPCNIVVNT
jgi:hypothetical protein